MEKRLKKDKSGKTSLSYLSQNENKTAAQQNRQPPKPKQTRPNHTHSSAHTDKSQPRKYWCWLTQSRNYWYWFSFCHRPGAVYWYWSTPRKHWHWFSFSHRPRTVHWFWSTQPRKYWYWSSFCHRPGAEYWHWLSFYHRPGTVYWHWFTLPVHVFLHLPERTGHIRPDRLRGARAQAPSI